MGKAGLENIDRRIIYALVLCSLSLPLVFRWSLPPAEMKSATALYEVVENLQSEKGKIALLALDFSPSTQAENRPQALVVLEHLMRKRIPVALISISPYAAPFLDQYPRQVAEQLMREDPSQIYRYGVDWVNIGYRPNPNLVIQGMAKAEDIRTLLKADAAGVPLMDIPCMASVKTLRDILLLGEFTGLVGAFNLWIQFFQARDFRPPMVHGCTSITIPEAFIYFNSKQIVGLLEGVAGAAWYEELLASRYPRRTRGEALLINSTLAIAQLVILGLVLAGNIGYLQQRRRRP